MLRSGISRFGRSRSAAAFVSLLERLPTAADRLSVLTYHRIGDASLDGHLSPALISTSAAAFGDQMAHIARRHHPVTANELLAARDGQSLPSRSVLITFDDAYRDFAELAWPILERHGVPAVLFVPTAYPDASAREFWWDRLFATLRALRPPTRLATPAGDVPYRSARDLMPTYRRLVAIAKSLSHADAMTWLDEMTAASDLRTGSLHQILGWQELRQLASAGATLAAHSRNHPRLDRLSDAELADEVAGSRRELDTNLGMPSPPIFAYPDGAHDERVLQAVAAAGYRVAFTTRRGSNSLGDVDWLRMRRINIGQRSTLPLIRAQLLAPTMRTSAARRNGLEPRQTA